ncbi:MAG: AMP-dependent synthetase/ligase [Spirochaetota bacterium]
MIPETIPMLLDQMAESHTDVAAQYMKQPDGQFVPRTFAELRREAHLFAAGLSQIGVKRGEHVGLISENRPEWLVADLGIQCLGAADVPRGNDSMADELGFILGFSECAIVVVENADQLAKVAGVSDQIATLKQFVVLDREFTQAQADERSAELGSLLNRVRVHTYDGIIASGTDLLARTPDFVEAEVAKGQGKDLCTIIFTSGTTGEPKGVMLTHSNYMFEISCIPERIDVTPGDIWLCVLPVWHSFERIVQYVALGSASALAYSKPIGKIMLDDMAIVRPQWMASVPRIWEAVRAGIYRNVNQAGGVKLLLFNFFVAVGGAHMRLSNMLRGLVPDFRPRSRVLDKAVAALPWLLLWPFRMLGNALVFGKIKARLGGRFIAGVSGGGALPAAVDTFFGAAGILLLEGYGLTETAPVLAVRHQTGPVPGTVGTLLRDTECRILAEDGTELPPGEMGVIYVRGPQVMRGYYRRPEATSAVLAEDGWFDTGDLGMMAHRGELKITGRAKDTIVLLGGENIEPLPIEQRITESEFIDTAVVVGQDQKYLGALLVPNRDAVERYADENHVPYEDYPDLLQSEVILELMDGEINSRVNAKNGFKGFERIFRFALIEQPFEVGKELSAKQEIKRHVIAEEYRRKIDALFV